MTFKSVKTQTQTGLRKKLSAWYLIDLGKRENFRQIQIQELFGKLCNLNN